MYDLFQMILELSEDRQLYRAFQSERYLKELASAFNNIFMANHEDWGQVAVIFSGANRFWDLIYNRDPSFLRNWEDLVEGDYANFLVGTLQSLPHEDETSIEFAIKLIRELGKYTIYPSIIARFSERDLISPFFLVVTVGEGECVGGILGI